jgi:hypothetical protein
MAVAHVSDSESVGQYVTSKGRLLGIVSRKHSHTAYGSVLNLHLFVCLFVVYLTTLLQKLRLCSVEST